MANSSAKTRTAESLPLFFRFRGGSLVEAGESPTVHISAIAYGRLDLHGREFFGGNCHRGFLSFSLLGVRVLARFVLKYTLRVAHLELGGVNLDLAVEDDVLPFDRAYMSKQVPVEGKIRRGGHSRDLLGLPIDDAGENQGQTGTGFHLIMDFACADTASLSVVDGARQGMELFDLQQTSAALGLSPTKVRNPP